MPDTLMLPFQRPSDAELAVLRLVEDGPVEIPEDERYQVAMSLYEDKQLLWQDEDGYWHSTYTARLVLAACDAEAAGDGGQVEAKGTTRCPLCGYDEPHYAANHREDTPFRPEIDWAFESFEEAWMKVFAGPRVWSPNELDREAGGFAYKDEEVEAKWQIFRTGWLLARGRRDVLPNRD